MLRRTPAARVHRGRRGVQLLDRKIQLAEGVLTSMREARAPDHPRGRGQMHTTIDPATRRERRCFRHEVDERGIGTIPLISCP